MINTEPGTTREKELNNLASNCDVKQSHENQIINGFYIMRDKIIIKLTFGLFI